MILTDHVDSTKFIFAKMLQKGKVELLSCFFLWMGKEMFTLKLLNHCIQYFGAK